MCDNYYTLIEDLMRDYTITVKNGYIGFTVSEETYNAINAFCDKHGVNTTTIMRVAVEMYLEDMKDVKPLNEKRS